MKNLKILLCDDSDDVRAHFTDLLKKCEVQSIFEASDGSQVIELLTQKFTTEEVKINLLITDFIMPEKDGLTLVKEIRGFTSKDKELESYLRNLPIIVATAEGEINSMMSFVEAGVNTYLLKPCDKITLVKKIQEALS